MCIEDRELTFADVTRTRVYAYVTCGDEMVVFREPDFPEVGVQVPAGTLEPGEDPFDAVLREAHEETGLSGLSVVRCLADIVHDMREFGIDEIQRAIFFHLRSPHAPERRWAHEETSGGSHEPIRFELWWVAIRDAPELAALDGAYVSALDLD